MRCQFSFVYLFPNSYQNPKDQRKNWVAENVGCSSRDPEFSPQCTDQATYYHQEALGELVWPPWALTYIQFVHAQTHMPTYN